MSGSVISPAEAADIVRRLTPGASFIYYMGDMASDRAERCGRAPTERAEAVTALADFMQTQGRDGEFVNSSGKLTRCWGNGQLTQQRRAERVYYYYFTRGA